MSDEPTEVNLKGLENFLAALKKLPKFRVGIMGSKAGRSDATGLTNAELGAMHEFGTSKMPQRSFLREPINDQLPAALEEAGAMDPAVLQEAVKTKTLKPLVEKIAIIAEGVVLEAFANGGFGKWQGWKNGYENNTGNILVDSQQLRNSISYEIK